MGIGLSRVDDKTKIVNTEGLMLITICKHPGNETSERKRFFGGYGNEAGNLIINRSV